MCKYILMEAVLLKGRRNYLAYNTAHSSFRENKNKNPNK